MDFKICFVILKLKMDSEDHLIEELNRKIEQKKANIVAALQSAGINIDGKDEKKDEKENLIDIMKPNIQKTEKINFQSSQNMNLK